MDYNKKDLSAPKRKHTDNNLDCDMKHKIRCESKPAAGQDSTSVKNIVSESKDKMQIKLGGALKKQPIKIELNPSQKAEEKTPAVIPKSATISSVFNEDSDSDQEEIPFEARMRMRNIGRQTPTACGPNSYGKGSLGFVDRRKLVEKEIAKQQEELGKS